MRSRLEIQKDFDKENADTILLEVLLDIREKLIQVLEELELQP